jgi:hypothetical protein
MVPLHPLAVDAYMIVGETVSTLVLLPLYIISNRGKSPLFFLLTARSSL